MFKISQYVAKLQAMKGDCLTGSVHLGAVVLKDEELARDLGLAAVVSHRL